MDVVVGTLILPRASASSGKPGEVFFVRVLAPSGPGRWLIEAGGRQMTVATAAELTVGQKVHLRLASAATSGKSLQVAAASQISDVPQIDQAFSAFVKQGLTLIPGQLRRLERWLERHASVVTPSEAEAWSGALAARSWATDQGPGGEALQAWLHWETSLSQGESIPPPQEDFWELWNSVPAQGNVQLVGVPFQWQCEETTHWGLLKAELPIPPRQPLTWSVLTTAWGAGFRIGWRTDGHDAIMTIRVFDSAAHERLSRQWSDLETDLLERWGKGFRLVLESDKAPLATLSYRPGEVDAKA